MTSRDFCYWLQGFFEISGGGGNLSQVQTGMIRKHLALVFKHEIDPSYGDEKHQEELNAIHNPPPKTAEKPAEPAFQQAPHFCEPPKFRC